MLLTTATSTRGASALPALRCLAAPSSWVLATVMTFVSVAQANCFEDAARRYGVDAGLLRAVATVESGMRPGAVGINASSGTRDLGLMQVNTSWLPKLARYGIDEVTLLEPCTNVKVGAWVLADALQRHGQTWEAIGAYNAACTRLRGDACTQARSRYAWRVYRQLQRMQAVSPSAFTPKKLRADTRLTARTLSIGLLSAQATLGDRPVPGQP